MSEEKRHLAMLALGRIFRMGARPTQPGDIEEYERCRAIVMDAADPVEPDWTPDHVRDRNRGSGQ